MSPKPSFNLGRYWAIVTVVSFVVALACFLVLAWYGDEVEWHPPLGGMGDPPIVERGGFCDLFQNDVDCWRIGVAALFVPILFVAFGIERAIGRHERIS